MNKYINNKTLAVLFVLLLSLAYFPFMRDDVNPISTVEKSDKLVNSPSEDIIEVRITNLSDTFSLLKTDEGWKVGENKAISDSVYNMLKSLEEAKIIKVESENPENFTKFGVADGTEISVTVIAPNESYNFVLGRRGTASGTFYVLLPEKNKVYLAKGGLLSTLSVTEDSWRDKTIFNIPPEDLASIEMKEENTILMNETSDNWGAAADVFYPLKAFGFLSDEERTEFDAISYPYELKIEKKDGTIFDLLYTRKENSYWMKYNNEYYKISSTNFFILE